MKSLRPWHWVAFWLATGLGVTGLAARMHPGWYHTSYHDEVDNFALVLSVTVWPLPLLVLAANEVIPHEPEPDR